MKPTRTLCVWLSIASTLLLGCTTDNTPEQLPEGFTEKIPEEILFTNAEIAYMGDDIGEQTSDGWLLKLYTDMEIDSAGNPIGPGCVMQILLNVPYNPEQVPSTALLRGLYSAQPTSSTFSPGTFVDGYMQYIDLPGERLELPDASFFATLEEGSTKMDIDLLDDGSVRIAGAGDDFVVEGVLVGQKCIKRYFSWNGKLEPTSYAEPVVPNSTLTEDLSLTNLSQLHIQDRGDYFALRDESCRVLLLYLTEEGFSFEWGKPVGSGELLRLELLVPWSWDATEGVPEGTYPMLARNQNTSIDRTALTPYHAISGLPNSFTYPYWSGCWFVEMASGEWTTRYARIDGGEVSVERGEDGSHHIRCTLLDSTATPYKVEAEMSFDKFINL